MTKKHSWIYDLLFILVLLVAGYLRLTGVQWGEGQHQHPDELFLTGVLDGLRAQTCIDPSMNVDICPDGQKRFLSIGEYFDTQTSTLSPYNRGYSFFVYGNLPMTLTRIGVELSGNDKLGSSKFFARQFSALADLLTIFLLYLIVARIYDRRTALLATAFSALAVMQIQQSHFFTTDLFVNFFMFLAIYFAVLIVTYKKEELGIRNEELEIEQQEPNLQPIIPNYQLPVTNIFRNPLLWFSLAFGFALGMAMASKINAAVLALMLPGAFAIRYFNDLRPSTFNLQSFDVTQEKPSSANRPLSANYWSLIALFLIAGGLATIISFRIFQPYAFDGIGLNPQWTANIAEQRGQANGDADLPWNLQWARRTHLYSFTNLTVWGLGLPLGILAWIGFIFMGWQIVKGGRKHILLWAWTALYFTWQSLQFNPTMRYQLPVYPLLCMMAAWAAFEFRIRNSEFRIANYALRITGLAVLVLTAMWAFAFHSIYLRDETRMAASRWIYENAPGPINLQIKTADRIYNQPLSFPVGGFIQSGAPYSTTFVPKKSGTLMSMTFAHASNVASSPVTVALSISQNGNTFRASTVVNPVSLTDPRGDQVSFVFEKPIPISTGTAYNLSAETLGGSVVALSGSGIANETDYDWGLPFRVDGYDPFGGMYRGDLNLQVYWDDNPDKLARFVDTLSQADYIVIPTNHQYAQITRLPERYPLTTEYYRQLIGCPTGEDIIHCYRVAKPGTYRGALGFELAQVFESYPTLGSIVINDQAAEEAFTFYDHPKVLIFKKSKNFESVKVQSILGKVDLTHVVHLTPKQAGNYEPQKDLLLPKDRLEQQRAGGTWSELFSYDWIQNKYPVMGLIIWYAFIFLLGLVAYPITRLALSGLKQYSYPLSRIVGLVLIAWVSWMGGSLGVPYTRTSIAGVVILVTLIGLGLGWTRRDQIRDEWNSSRRFFTVVEILFLVFFLIDLLIRIGNPDLWHPSKGGERPMDFSYFNAVLKSGSFPPYDPWYAGGYINYYYYGFVLAGTPVKLLGIVPSIAYNLILPTWFALIAVGAFAIGYSMVEGYKFKVEGEGPATFNLQFVTGIAASLMTVLIGNLGTVKLIFSGFQRIAAPGGTVPVDATFFEKWKLALQGLFMSFGGAMLPIGRGDWYWFPSRVIPAPGDIEPITEFPLFTFLYSDMHAHMLVMPITLFIIAWAVSFIKSRAQMNRAEWIATFSIGALMIGALRPTNTWDLYTYFPLAAIALVYTLYRNFDLTELKLPEAIQEYIKKDNILLRAVIAIAAVGLLYEFSSLLYLPFTYWYAQGYGKVDPWLGSHTPISSYLTQWGLFLFIIVAWLVWETREWMAATPVSHLKKLRDYALPIEIGLAAVIALLAFFAVKDARVGWLALPLAAWAGILILRPNMPDIKRGVLLMIGTALVLTMAVEIVVLVGDIGRMNTVFKLYLQAWMLLAVSAAAAFGWLLNAFPFWRFRWRMIYQIGLYLLLSGAFLFTLTASTDKVSDRMTLTAPHTLDSMTYMKTSQHWDGNIMDLGEDYRAIRWMQDNVKGSPVIVEANCTEYRWCTRFTIYTGLPGVIGWNWHQRQQRGFISIDVQQRVDEIGIFYTMPDIEWARAFLKKYQVKYIIVGQLERNVYPPVDSLDGLTKFAQYDGQYWKSIYHDNNTTIYEVLP
jgi:YYY domain-containing protein